MSRPPASAARAVPVPSGRIKRLARLGTLATGIAGGAALRAAGGLARGTRPDPRDLLITPGNLARVAEELARMRGAAMKIGQLLSMDGGEVLPPDLARILARLRDDAHFMPPKQLREVLNATWGPGWLPHFQRFDPRPVAAASIGQVHRARLRDGREVAIKVQYPGVARSIDSDVANVGALIRLSGLLPKGFEIAPYLEEARRQLHEETDYLREGAHLRAFGDRLAGDPAFAVPAFHEDWSTGRVLTMSYLAGDPIEDAAGAPPARRNRIATDLIRLMLRELFDFGVMQSDPNFANYRIEPETDRIILLDFGATRDITPDTARRYRAFFAAGLSGDGDGLRAAALSLGYLSDADPAGQRAHHQDRVFAMIETVFEAVRAAPEFDFAGTDLPARLRTEGMALAEDGYVPPPVPMDLLYLQRKFGGLFLLAQRLRARVPVRELIGAHLSARGA